VLIAWFMTFFGGVFLLGLRGRPVAHAIYAVGMIIVLLLVCYWKGERPRWRWGD
jgi:hypothetical protein